MKIRKIARTTLDLIGQYKLYFLRGYQGYFALILSVVNTSAIMYYLIIDNLTAIPDWIRYSTFSAIFIILLLFGGIIVGRFDMRRGTFRREQEELGKRSPLWSRVFKQLDRIEKRLDEIERRI